MIHTGTTAAIECIGKGIKVLKYLPERIDIDPLLSVDIQQVVVTDKSKLFFPKKIFNFKKSKERAEKLVSEPLNNKVWDEVLLND